MTCCSPRSPDRRAGSAPAFKAGRVGNPTRDGPGHPALARTARPPFPAVPGAPGRDTAIHEARKATKWARYAAEAAVPAVGSTTKRQATKAKELQQLLGDHHDSVVARMVCSTWPRWPGRQGRTPSPTA